MLNFAKWPIVLGALVVSGYVPLVCADTSLDKKVATSLQGMLPALVKSGDFRSASNVSFQLASAHGRLGDASAACAALSQSFKFYREAMVKGSGQPEADDSGEVATLYNDGYGRAQARAKFGCSRT
jgi:hypothetical protein